MKSILKSQRLKTKGQAYKQVLFKLPRKVTFTFDQPFNQRGNTKMKQSNYKNSSLRCNNINNSQSTLSQNQLLENQWEQQSQFRRHNTEWNNFILIYNPKFTGNTLYCGKCHKSFGKIVQFIFHCLSDCKEICHNESSHFILQIGEWKNFIAKNQANSELVKQTANQKQKQQKQTTLNIVQENIKEQQQKSVKQPANESSQPTALLLPQIQTKNKQSEQKLKRIYQFSKQIIELWRDKKIQNTFIYETSYIQLFNLILVINPLIKRPQSLSVKACNTCKSYYSSNKFWFLYHYKQKCSKINTQDSQILILNAQLFYQFLYQQKNYNLAYYSQTRLINNVDLGFLTYLYENGLQQKEIDKLYPSFKFYCSFIKIFYLFFEGYNKIDYNSQFRQKKLLKKERLPWEQFKIIFIKDQTYLRQVIQIVEFQQYLKDQKLFCPKCHEKQMTYQEFITHLKNKHKDGQLNIYLSKSLK